MNIWLSLRKARLIAADLERRFKGRSAQGIDDALLDHPLYEDHMWLDVDWDDDEIVGIKVGISGGFIF